MRNKRKKKKRCISSQHNSSVMILFLTLGDHVNIPKCKEKKLFQTSVNDHHDCYLKKEKNFDFFYLRV